MKKLVFNYRSQRFEIGDKELHCGDCFQIFHQGKWHDVRIEHASVGGDHGWYLVGFIVGFGDDIRGLEARLYS